MSGSPLCSSNPTNPRIEIEGVSEDGKVNVGTLSGIKLEGVYVIGSTIETNEAANTGLKIDPTNGLIIYGSGSPVFQADSYGNIMANNISAFAGGTTSGIEFNSAYVQMKQPSLAGTSFVKIMGGLSIEAYAPGSQIINIHGVNAGVSIGGNRVNITGALVLNTGTMSYVFLENLTGSEPSTPTSGGGYLYAWGGALKYISSGGTRTTIAPN